MKIVCEQRCDEGLRTFQNGNIGNVEFIRTDFDKRRVLGNTINAKHGVLLDYGAIRT